MFFSSLASMDPPITINLVANDGVTIEYDGPAEGLTSLCCAGLCRLEGQGGLLPALGTGGATWKKLAEP